MFVTELRWAGWACHNRRGDRLRTKGTAETELFEGARLATCWHYQWVILREYLPVLIGSDLTSELLDRGPELYRPANNPYMPLEFADAAFRYGHGQIRQRYRVNDQFGPAPIFPDLMGFGPVAPDRCVDWTLLFDVPGQPAAQRAKRIDGRLASSLIDLPFEVSGARSGSELASLANRDLSRGQKVGLPSGEALARRMGREPIDASQVGLAGRRRGGGGAAWPPHPHGGGPPGSGCGSPPPARCDPWGARPQGQNKIDRYPGRVAGRPAADRPVRAASGCGTGRRASPRTDPDAPPLRPLRRPPAHEGGCF